MVSFYNLFCFKNQMKLYLLIFNQSLYSLSYQAKRTVRELVLTQCQLSVRAELPARLSSGDATPHAITVCCYDQL